MTIKKLEHVGVVVKSIEESAAFYEKTLGLELKELRQPGPNVRLGFLGFPDDEASIIEFVERSNAEPASEGVVNHIAFAVDDIEKEAARITALGAAFLNERIITTGDGTRFTFFAGPDGERLELYQPALKCKNSSGVNG
ncbi:VOC family protein [Paenibacillus sp. HB172176]|uniref:VOC family protein n=1 Tax=Paenibacillus sp. HB172176 TaxID=2493690 RepID=UPI0014392B53|nr:VOC family protein [Paenibacillus sp. HB172176]